MSNDMTTDEFLNALKRMINHAGWCRTIVSDNQGTFKKANQVWRCSISEYFGKNNVINLFNVISLKTVLCGRLLLQEVHIVVAFMSVLMVL